MKQAWNSSFARTKSNQKATLHRGWGPKALNYNVLCHPEIATSHNGSTHSSLPTSTVPAEELNLSQGLSGTLVDRIVVHKNREATDGDDALEQMRKRKATAEEQIKSQNKRMTAGLLASSGHFHLSVDVRDYVQEKANVEQEGLVRAQFKRREEYNTLKAKVDAIKQSNLPPERWTSVQLKTMLKWLKRNGDTKLPTKKDDQLCRYNETCNREDLPPPPVPVAV